jgi:hypothetical protein
MIRSLGMFLIVLSTGCASTTARTVLRDRDGGVVAIPENTDRFPDYNRSQAIDLIRDHLGKEFEIVREEEYVIGPVTTSETNFTKRPALGWLVPWRWSDQATTTSTSATRNQTEYRLHYRRSGVPDAVRPAEYKDLPPLRDGIGER